MAIKIEVPEGIDALTEFIQFFDQVYAYRDAKWTAEVEFQLPLLTGESPFTEDRIIRPFLVRRDGRMVGRAVAAVDKRYVRHWGDNLGHIGMFEAMPGDSEAIRLLMNAACDWLKEQGMEAARSGFHFGVSDLPFAIDDYETLPPPMVRQNPAYYHSLFKEARFLTEQGFVDYKIQVQPELQRQWADTLKKVQADGFEIIPMRDVPESGRGAEIWNSAFGEHWGFTPSTDAEFQMMLGAFEPLGVLETSVMAFRDGAPVGSLFVVPNLSSMATLSPGRTLTDAEQVNMLGIGVLESARGTGVNLAMCAYSFAELIRQGAKYLSYTLVVDDNWPSRRTAEKLGAYVCANYVTYRRDFR